MEDSKPKTILLVFIHGFKGDDLTFSAFPKHLSERLSAELVSRASRAPPPDDYLTPELAESTSQANTSTAPSAASQPPTIKPLLYPSFETRGDLSHTVARLRAWLLEKVIDAEVARGTPSPTVTPGVGVVLVGHSMGGIVGADAVLGIATEFWDDTAAVKEEEQDAGIDGEKLEEEKRAESQAEGGQAEDAQQASMFPKVLGVLAYDTPYLGIAPGVVKYGAEEQYRQGKNWYDGASGAFAASKWAGLSGKKDGAAEVTPKTSSGGGSAWNTWGKTALLASAGVAAAGGAAYAGRQYLGTGFNWVSSHLAFVGCLAREQDLRKRFGGMVMLAERGIHRQPPAAAALPSTTTVSERLGFAIFYTLLDPRATALPDQTSPRTFCRLPRGAGRSGIYSSQEDNAPASSQSNTRSASAPPASGGPSQPPKSHAVQEKEKATDEHWRHYWVHATNSKAANEVGAHVAMFDKAENPEYDQLLGQSADAVGRWVEKWALG